MSGPVASDPAQRARPGRETGEFPRLQAVHDTGEFERVRDTSEFARVESSHETGEFSAVQDTGEFELLHDPQHEADRERYGSRSDGSRRTVVITGRGSEHHRPSVTRGPGRRSAQRVYERPGFNPDRIAMWAVLLGLVLVLVAATSSHAAVLQAHHAVAHLLHAR
ncbi:MAG TPA: hypothetical protein VG223_03445 [Solirubrobacteraceae bacterium]|nr:hypothetical protein [Solirubrobacteraceae bacterium]